MVMLMLSRRRRQNLISVMCCKCEDGSVAHSVLVEGALGVGKTTFVFELCKQWARGEILQECGVVVIIKLQDQRIRTAQAIDDLLYHPDPEICQAVTELVERDGKGMLLILDGYDELTTKQRESGSVIQLLMSRELLCRATLMVTSRPLASRTLHPNFQQSIDQHIEVLGFTDRNTKEYIISACGDNPELVQCFQLSRSTFSYLHVLHHFCKFKLYFALTICFHTFSQSGTENYVAPIEPIQSRHFISTAPSSSITNAIATCKAIKIQA